MATYEVMTDLIIHTRVRVTVEAGSKEDAIDAVAELLPANHDLNRAKQWRARVDLKPPMGVQVRVIRTYHFEQASGSDKAMKISD